MKSLYRYKSILQAVELTLVVCCKNFPVVTDFTTCPSSAAAVPHSLGPGGFISTLAYFHAVEILGLAAFANPASVGWHEH